MDMGTNVNVGNEITRINEIMTQTSSGLLTEVTDPTRKFAADVVDAFIGSPKALEEIFEELGLQGLGKKSIITAFQENSEQLLKLSKKTAVDGVDGWDDMIRRNTNVDDVTDWVDTSTGKHLTDNDIKIKYYDEGLSLSELDALYTKTTRYYKEVADGTMREIKKVEYDKLLKDNSDFHSLPPILRFSRKEIENMLEGVDGTPKIKDLDEFIIALNRFLKGSGGELTEPLRKAILATLSNFTGFTKLLKNAFINHAAFYKRVKFHRINNSLDQLDKAMKEVLGFKEGSKLLDDLSYMFSKEAILIETYFAWLKKSWGPWKAIQQIRFGTVQNKFKTYIVDIGVGAFWDYAMGAQIIKSLLTTIKSISKKDKPAFEFIWRIAVGLVLFGSYKTVRDWGSGNKNPWKALFEDMMEKFNNCAGENKVTDALTGKLYKNVSSTKEVEGEDGIFTRITCPTVEFSAAFIEVFTFSEKKDPGIVKAAAEGLYNALNLGSHDGHALSIGKNSYELFGYEFTTDKIKNIPSLTKVFMDYVGLWGADDSVVQNVVEKDGMDILKMSQIAYYYETHFNASLLEDAMNLDQWESMMGGMNFSEFQERIENLPYLNGESVDFNSWDEVEAEAEKLIIKYPFKGVYEYEEDGETFAETVKLAKCGDGCTNDAGEPCNCNTGGCDIGGTDIGASVFGILVEKGYNDQAKINTLVKTKEGFDELKKIFDEQEQINGIGCVLIGRTND